MRYPASEKLEIIRLVEQSALPIRRTLEKIGIARATFYRWYDLCQTGGPEGLDDRRPKPDRIWNRMEFPNKFETIVGERGITLSGGQKQRTALARAILRDPKILVLDDALSSVDTGTEEKILRGLKDVMRNRTTILISHRCSTVRHADQIIVLRAGEIVERGTHEELLALGGYYADLYQKQLLEEELEQA